MRKRRNRAAISGTAVKPRLSVFRSNTAIYAQLIDDDKGVTLAAARGKDPVVAGATLATQAKKAGITKAVFNKGQYKFHGQVKALAESVRNTGIAL